MSKYGITTYRDYIYVYYAHQNQRFTISTRFRSEELFNPDKKNLDQRHPDYSNAKIVVDDITKRMIFAAQKVMTAGFEPTCNLVRQEYDKALNEPGPGTNETVYPDFYDMWHEFMLIKSAEMRPDGFRSYTQLYKMMREFEHFDNYKMDFRTFDQVMFGRMKQFMFLVKEYKDATTLKLVKKLRSFYHWAVPDIDRSFIHFRPNPVLNIHPLEPDELLMVINAELSGHLDKTRDLFVFCACTGMRYSDSQRFHREWVRDGLIEYTQRKTSQEALVPMLDTANKILVKYGFDTPKISNQVYNRYIKDLFKELEITRVVKVHTSVAGKKEERLMSFWQQAGSHTARKTFITYALYRGVAIQDVMKMSGHYDYQTIKPYIAISKDHIKQQGCKFGL